MSHTYGKPDIWTNIVDILNGVRKHFHHVKKALLEVLAVLNRRADFNTVGNNWVQLFILEQLLMKKNILSNFVLKSSYEKFYYTLFLKYFTIGYLLSFSFKLVKNALKVVFRAKNSYTMWTYTFDILNKTFLRHQNFRFVWA